jgi:hypothetical protein
MGAYKNYTKYTYIKVEKAEGGGASIRSDSPWGHPSC